MRYPIFLKKIGFDLPLAQIEKSYIGLKKESASGLLAEIASSILTSPDEMANSIMVANLDTSFELAIASRKSSCNDGLFQIQSAMSRLTNIKGGKVQHAIPALE